MDTMTDLKFEQQPKTYYVLYYKKGIDGCQIQKGFTSRLNSLNFLKTFWDDVEWYSIEEDNG